ncbi:MAG: metal-binding protein, partial [Thermoplasmataceae archaeon]
INFSFFSRELVLDFPVTPEDLKFIKEMVRINNIEVFINKICRRRYEFFKRHVIPSNDEINLANAIGETSITANNIIENDSTIKAGRGGSMILSSGGKESLLSMGIMKKIGEDVHPFFFNESGSHWLPAKTSYEYFRNSGYNPLKVWSNTDRFYKKTLRNMDILDKRQIERKTDTYPVQLFIFPVYLLSSLPLVIKLGVSNIIMGNEFDDPLAM